MIIGVVGAVSLIAIVLLICILVWRKRSLRRRRMNEEGEVYIAKLVASIFIFLLNLYSTCRLDTRYWYSALHF